MVLKNRIFVSLGDYEMKTINTLIQDGKFDSRSELARLAIQAYLASCPLCYR